MEPEEYLAQNKQNVRIDVDKDGLIRGFETSEGYKHSYSPGAGVALIDLNSNTTKCERCHKQIRFGDYPFCPHEKGTNAVASDEIVGGMVMEHLYPGRKVYYKSELKQLLKAKGYQIGDDKTEATHAKFLKERAEYAGDTQKERDRERLER